MKKNLIAAILFAAVFLLTGCPDPNSGNGNEGGSLNSLDSSCSWTTTTYTNGNKYLVISNATGEASSSTNGSYQYSISGSTLTLKGRMAFGMASSTTWTKE